MKWATLATLLLLVVLGSLLFIQWEQLQVMRAMVARETTVMTDPGPQELKASWIHAYNSNHEPIYTVVSIVRNAPSETVTAWEDRFKAEIAAALVDPDRKPYVP